MHSCLICIGSNYNRKENLLLARRRLTALFPSIRFTGEQETRPLFFRNPALFSNQMARFYTDADAERVVKELKTSKERPAGSRKIKRKKRYAWILISLFLMTGS